MPLETQFGFVDEVTYGTAVTVTRFMEYNSEAIEAVYDRPTYAGMRSGQVVPRTDRFVPIPKGAAGPVKFNPLTVGFGFWLKHMLGGTATSAPTDSVYTHTGTVATHKGDAFTAQVNRYDDVSAANRAFTWEGGKIASWELMCDVDGYLECTLNMDFETQATATALASASYPSGGELFAWSGAEVDIASTGTNVTGIKIAMDNGLDTDAYRLKASSTKLQPLNVKNRQITWELTADFDSMTNYNRFASATAAGALAQIDATWTGATLVGASTYSTVVATVDQARFDAASVTVGGEGRLMAKFSGIGMFDGSTSPVTIAYGSADATA